MMVTVHPPATSPFARPAAPAQPTWRSSEPVLRDWLPQHKDSLFRWTLARGGDAAARRGFAEGAVAIQRLRGEGEFVDWLLAAAVLAAHRDRRAVLASQALSGLPPELRALLRLVAQGDLRIEEALALLPQRMDYVRQRLVRTRLVTQRPHSLAWLMNA
ncbi:hypothetical protein AACH10_16825 [Ideonella sp. DXS22W]|uniref:DUF2336 domain-containing protein n=1 Tax=Pseudaquabacterium inlustre TaxID=2984192 RepID=A0ABU9CMG6_9BURK